MTVDSPREPATQTSTATRTADALEAGSQETAESIRSPDGAQPSRRVVLTGDLRKVSLELQKRTMGFLDSAGNHSKHTHSWFIAIEGRLHYLLVNLPVAGPLTAALLCTYLLIFQDIQPPLDTPWLFQLSLLFCVLAALGWLGVQTIYSLGATLHGLAPRQRKVTVAFLVISGLSIFFLRMGHLIWFSTTRVDVADVAEMAGSSVTELDFANRIGEVTDERLRRIFVGVPYAAFRYVGLDMWGWAIGKFVFYAVLLGGFFCCCCFNCCGATRLFQSITRRSRDGMPFTDMVSNRVTSSSFNGVLFMYPFVVLSTFVLGGTVLIEPSRSFAPAGSPATMGPLCSPVVSANLYALTTGAASRIGQFVMPASLYEFASSDRKARILGNMLLDIAWKSALEPIETQCDGIYAISALHNVSSLAVPRFAVAVRDVNDQSALLRASSVVSVTLLRQPADVAFDGSSCMMRATLLGQTALGIGTAGVSHISGLRLNATAAGADNDSMGAPMGALSGMPLCPGDYVLRLALHESTWLSERLADFDAVFNSTLSDDLGQLDLTPRLFGGELPDAVLYTDVTIRIVPVGHAEDTRVSEWSTDMPAFYNPQTMQRIWSTVTYTEVSTRGHISTTVTTNLSSVPYSYNYSTLATNYTRVAQTATFGGLSSAARDAATNLIDRGSSGAVVWDADNVTTAVQNERKYERAPQHILNFLRRPPQRVHLRQPFEVALRLATENGFPLPAEEVQAILLAPLGSAASLSSGAHGFTDENGVVAFNMSVHTGSTSDYLLLFGSSGTMRASPRREMGAAMGAMADVLGQWRRNVEPLAESISSGFSSFDAGNLVNQDALFSRIRNQAETTLRSQMGSVYDQMGSCLTAADQLSRPFASLLQLAGGQGDLADVFDALLALNRTGDAAGAFEALIRLNVSGSPLDTLAAFRALNATTDPTAALAALRDLTSSASLTNTLTALLAINATGIATSAFSALQTLTSTANVTGAMNALYALTALAEPTAALELLQNITDTAIPADYLGMLQALNMDAAMTALGSLVNLPDPAAALSTIDALAAATNPAAAMNALQQLNDLADLTAIPANHFTRLVDMDTTAIPIDILTDLMMNASQLNQQFSQDANSLPADVAANLELLLPSVDPAESLAALAALQASLINTPDPVGAVAALHGLGTNANPASALASLTSLAAIPDPTATLSALQGLTSTADFTDAATALRSVTSAADPSAAFSTLTSSRDAAIAALNNVITTTPDPAAALSTIEALAAAANPAAAMNALQQLDGLADLTTIPANHFTRLVDMDTTAIPTNTLTEMMRDAAQLNQQFSQDANSLPADVAANLELLLPSVDPAESLAALAALQASLINTPDPVGAVAALHGLGTNANPASALASLTSLAAVPDPTATLASLEGLTSTVNFTDAAIALRGVASAADPSAALATLSGLTSAADPTQATAAIAALRTVAMSADPRNAVNSLGTLTLDADPTLALSALNALVASPDPADAFAALGALTDAVNPAEAFDTLRSLASAAVPSETLMALDALSSASDASEVVRGLSALAQTMNPEAALSAVRRFTLSVNPYEMLGALRGLADAASPAEAMAALSALNSTDEIRGLLDDVLEVGGLNNLLEQTLDGVLNAGGQFDLTMATQSISSVVESVADPLPAMGDALAGLSGQALSCFNRGSQAALVAAVTREDPATSENELTTGLLRSLLSSLNLGGVADMFGSLMPYANAYAQEATSAVDAFNVVSDIAEDAMNRVGANAEDPWVMTLVRTLLHVFGINAPPASVITVDAGVGSVELTAPLVGYSLLTSASANPYSNQLDPGVTGSACVREGYPSFMPSLRPLGRTRGISSLERFFRPIVDSLDMFQGMPLASPLWQPPLFMTHNWLLDSVSFLPPDDPTPVVPGVDLPQFGVYSPLCSSSWLTNNQLVPGTTRPAESTAEISPDGNLTAAASFNTVNALEVVPDPFFPRYEEAAALLEAFHGDPRAVARSCADRVSSGLDDEICAFASAHGMHSFASHRQPHKVANSTIGAANLSSANLSSANMSSANSSHRVRDLHHQPRVQHYSAKPRLIVRGYDGQPLSGRYCTVVDTAGTDIFSDILNLEVVVDSCGPSDADGVIVIEGLRVRGGGSRVLNLEARVEGIPARLSNRTFWRNDTVLRYISAEQPTLDKMDLISMQGHDSIRMLSLLVLPIFALNARSVHNRPAHIIWRILAVAAFAYLFWMSMALFQLFIGSQGLPAHHSAIFAIAPNDMTAFRTGGGDPMVLLPAIITLGVTLWIAYNVGWLLLRSEFSMVSRALDPIASDVKSHFDQASKKLKEANIDVDLLKGVKLAPDVLSQISQRAQEVVDDAFAGTTAAFAPSLAAAPSMSPPPSPPSTLMVVPADAKVGMSTPDAKHGLMRQCRKAFVKVVSRTLGWLGCSTGMQDTSAPWLEPSPGWMFESHAEQRSRLARNHVKTMLRGRRSYQVYIENREESFFFPQRLWMAFYLSIWIQLLIVLCFCSIVRWLGGFLIAAEDFDRKISVAAQYQVAFSDAERFSPLVRVIMVLVWAVAVPSGSSVPQLIHLALGVLGALLPGIFFALRLQHWKHFFKKYKKRVMKMRTGDYFFDRDGWSEEYANQFIGFQVAGMFISGWLFVITGLLITIPCVLGAIVLLNSIISAVTLQPAFEAFSGPLLLSIYRVAALFTFQYIFNRTFFFTGPTRANRWLRHRWWYALYDYNMILTNTLVGAGFTITRMAFWFIFGIMCLGRIDLCLMPEPFQKFDVGYRTYVAVCRMDHRYNNPVCVVFFNTLMRQVEVSRRTHARRILRRNFKLVWLAMVALRGITRRGKRVARALDHHALQRLLPKYIKKHDQVVATAQTMPKPPYSRHDLQRSIGKACSLMARQDEVHNRYRLARNRWQLALFMIRNPILQGYRWHALLYMQKKRVDAKVKNSACQSCKRLICACSCKGKKRSGALLDATPTDMARAVADRRAEYDESQRMGIASLAKSASSHSRASPVDVPSATLLSASQIEIVCEDSASQATAQVLPTEESATHKAKAHAAIDAMSAEELASLMDRLNESYTSF